MSRFSFLAILLLVSVIGYFIFESTLHDKGTNPIEQPLPSNSSFKSRSTKPLVIGQSWVNSLGVEFAWIPPGSFLMGRSPTTTQYLYSDEIPARKVNVKHGFWMATHEMTKAVLANVLPRFKEYGLWKHPIIEPAGMGVGWKDCMDFCTEFTQREEHLGLLNGCVYSLPTEAQWEYCCRAGSTGDFSTTGTYTIVGGPANAFGLFGMHNEGWEWCLDRWHENYDGAPSDERAWLSVTKTNRSFRVLRGGAFANFPCASPSSKRYKYNQIGGAHCPRSWVRIILISKTAHAELVDYDLLGLEPKAEPGD